MPHRTDDYNLAQGRVIRKAQSTKKKRARWCTFFRCTHLCIANVTFVNICLYTKSSAIAKACVPNSLLQRGDRIFFRVFSLTHPNNLSFYLAPISHLHSAFPIVFHCSAQSLSVFLMHARSRRQLHVCMYVYACVRTCPVNSHQRVAQE